MSVQMELYQHWDRTLETALIVDDDPSDRAELRTALTARRPDMQVVEFECLEQGRTFLHKASPDMVFLDHRLPDGWGGEFACELLNDPRHAGLPIFVITAEPLNVVDYRVIALNKDAVSEDTLATLIAEFLRLRRESLREPPAQLSRRYLPDGPGDIAGCASAAVREMRKVRAQIARSAPLEALARLEAAEDRIVALLDTLATSGPPLPR